MGAAFIPALLAASIPALLLRLLLLDHASLSLDEGFTRYWIEHDQRFLWGEGRLVETNPPLHFALLRAWTAVAGTSDLALRLPSAVAAAATVALGGWLARRIAGPEVGLLAATLLALWPLSVWHGTEARPAALNALFEALALAGAFLYLRDDRRFLGLAMFVAGSVAAIHTHATAKLFTAALGGGVLGTMLLGPKPGWRAVAGWIGAGLLILLASAPQLAVFAGERSSTNLAWIPHLSPWTIQSFLVPLGPGMGVFEVPSLLRLALLGVLVGAAALGAMRLRDPAAVAVLVVVPALFLVLLLAASLFRPMLLPRVALVLAVPFAILAALGIAARGGEAWRGPAAALLCGVLAFGVWMQVRQPATVSLGHTLRPDYRAVVRFLAEEGRCPGPVFSGHFWTLLGWPHYGPAPGGVPPAVVLFPQEEDYRVNVFATAKAGRDGTRFIEPADFLAQAAALPAAVVLVQRGAPSAAPMRAALATLEPRHAIERHSFGGGNAEIVVHCLRARSVAEAPR